MRRRTRAVVALAATAGLALGYWFVVRPWHRQWGTTADEATADFPGDELLPRAASQNTHAVTVDAPPEAVWPWLVQMGQGRGGFYTYNWLERLVGADIHNADSVVPELQSLEEGDTIRLAPSDYPVQSPETAPVVARLDPGRAIVLRPEAADPAWTWAFVLQPTDHGRTRFLSRMRSRRRESLVARLLDAVFWDPAHFVMDRGMLLGVKRRAEAAAQ
jgi:hypothetical protein